jgi:co-chaperonin GroES (HSP10)
MKPLFDFVIELPKAYEDTINVNGVELFKDTRFDDFSARVSYGTIKAIPAKWDIPEKVQVGDTLVFHHHVNQQPDKYGLGDDCYLVAYHPTELAGQAYMVIHQDESVTVLGDWIILEATEDKEEDIVSEGGLFLGTQKVEAKNEAVVLHTSVGTEELGLEVGNLVMYAKNADYRITLPDGSQVFRMKPNYIYAAYV